MNVNLIATSLFDKPEKNKYAFINSNKNWHNALDFNI